MKWLYPINSKKDSNTRIIFFPFAGGGVSSYRKLFSDWDVDAELLSVLLPGREARFSEGFNTNISYIIECISKEIRSLSPKNCFLYGHSMGAILAFEISLLLSKQKFPHIKKLFVSGARAPHMREDKEPLHLLSDKELFERLSYFGGFSNDFLAEQQLIDLILPVIRSDLSISENYKYKQGEKAPCPIYAIGGDQDIEVSDFELKQWKEQAKEDFDYVIYPGNHFFIYDNESEIKKYLSSKIL